MTETNVATNPSDEVIKEILGNMKRIAVIGFSAKEDRASHGISRFLQGQGLTVIGVNPGLVGQDVLGLPIVASLAEIAEPIDVVDVFRRSEAVPPIVEAAIAVGAKTIWMQEGVVHNEAAAKARTAGLHVVQDSCLYKEWLRLMNG